MKQILLILVMLFSFSCLSQNEKKFNLDFEIFNQRYLFPKDWIEWGDYPLAADTIIVHSGTYSGKIESKNKDLGFGSIAYKIPARYKGKTITLEGYMKIKNVKNGYAGLLLRIDGNDNILVGDNMESQNINGTKDWKKYAITLAYPEHAKSIYVAGIMTGTGEAWFDDFVLTIDGQDVQTLNPIEIPIPPATLDTEFDLGSKLEFPEPNEALISNLEVLGKIWGFLKYNHPEVCKGHYNWDFELFRMLPKYLEVKNIQERDQVLLDWISTYGEIDVCTECKETSPNAYLKPDMSWFNSYDLDTELIQKLTYIYNNRYQGEHFYIGKGPVGNPAFLNENEYYNMPFNDDGFKLLALYRYWNIIHYFFPYHYVTDTEWQQVLRAYIPVFLNTKTRLDYELAFIKLIGEINDTHASTTVGFTNVQNKRGEYYPPFKTQFINDTLVVGDYYNPELQEPSKINSGDVITHINNKPVQAILDSVRPYYPASNEVVKLRDIASDILRSNKNKISIDYISKHKKYNHQLPLYEKSSLNTHWYRWSGDTSYKLLDGNIGYVTLEFIKKEEIPILKDLFKNTKGIIIDIRNYPSTFVPFLLGPYFVSSPTPFVKFTKFNIDNPGEFPFTDPLIIPKGETVYKGKLVVLINENSQSQSEYTTMAFKTGDRTTVVGSTTAGADGTVSYIYLPGGLLTRISGTGIYYPDGTQTQRVGIIPDVLVRPTIKGIEQGKDEVLEKAIEIINE